MGEKNRYRASLYAVGGLTIYIVFFRALPSMLNNAHPANPYEAALLREGTAFGVLGLFSILFFVGLLILYLRKKNWRD